MLFRNGEAQASLKQNGSSRKLHTSRSPEPDNTGRRNRKNHEIRRKTRAQIQRANQNEITSTTHGQRADHFVDTFLDRIQHAKTSEPALKQPKALTKNHLHHNL